MKYTWKKTTTEAVEYGQKVKRTKYECVAEDDGTTVLMTVEKDPYESDRDYQWEWWVTSDGRDVMYGVHPEWMKNPPPRNGKEGALFMVKEIAKDYFLTSEELREV